MEKIFEKHYLYLEHSFVSVFYCELTLKMPNMIGVQIGQCGNQVGLAFWTELFKEHGIGPDGMQIGDDKKGLDNKDVFFYQVSVINLFFVI